MSCLKKRLRLTISSRLQRLLREGFWVVLGQAMSMLGSLVGVRLLTEVLSPEQYGELALGMTIATLVNQILLGPLGQGVLRFYAPAVERGELGQYLYAVRRLILMAIAVIGLLMLGGLVGLVAIKQTYLIAITLAALAFAGVNGCYSILNGMQNAARQRAVVALSQGLESWLRCFVAVGVIIWLGATSSIAMMGFVGGGSLVLVLQGLYFRQVIPRPEWRLLQDENKWQQQIWQYSWPFSIWGIFYWGQVASDRWALGLFASTREVAMYAVLFQLGYYPVSIATGASIQFLAPVVFQRVGDATNKKRNIDATQLNWRLTGCAVSLTAAAFLLTVFLHTQIFHIFVSKEYQSISYLLPWVALSGGFFASAQTISLNLMSQMKTRMMMIVKILISIFGIVLNFSGAYFYGIKGVISASVLTSVLYFLGMSLLSVSFWKKLNLA
jgi:O-antigen/teichoic acid export membrane protein